MHNLVRVSKVEGLPFRRNKLSTNGTTFKKYPEIFVKFGGSLFVDLDRLSEAIDKSRAQRDAK